MRQVAYFAEFSIYLLFGINTVCSSKRLLRRAVVRQRLATRYELSNVVGRIVQKPGFSALGRVALLANHELLASPLRHLGDKRRWHETE